MSIEIIRIGTRKSDLAVAQTRLVASLLEKGQPQIQTELVLKQTVGDKILNKPLLEFGGKGVFVSEFEQGLADGQIDLAVHSAKDLPMDLKEGLEIIAVPEREDPRDVLVTRKKEDLSQKTEIIIGTSSPRRKVQIEEIGKKLWPHACIRCENLRGNVNTRLKRLQEGGYDAILLAAAGLKRLGFLEKDSQELEPFSLQYLSCEEFIPAGGQGILAVEGRAQDSRTKTLCAGAENKAARLSLQTERMVLKLLDAGCHEPIGVYTRLQEKELELFGICGRNGQIRKVHLSAPMDQWKSLAMQAAKHLRGNRKMEEEKGWQSYGRN